MKIVLAQIKYRFGDFEYNFNKIISNLQNADLIIFSGLNEKIIDENFSEAKKMFYKKIATKIDNQALLIGNIFINRGNVVEINDDFIDIKGKKIYVASQFVENIDCDLYVLSKSGYFTSTTNEELIENIVSYTDFIYVNEVGLIDENVYGGESFAKNKNNEIVLKLPLCKEKVKPVDFNKKTTIKKQKKEEKIEKVLEFALKEYCEITGFKKVVLGLSGGIDSALTAVLATKAIGKENVLGIMLPSMYSSKGSIDDSLNLANNLGIKVEEISITPMFEKFMETFENKKDLAEENLQSRLRGLILMFLSNREGYLLLSTGNKSEIAMGYGTLYGDMAGGLNLIADLTKTNVYKLSKFINQTKEIIPVEIIKKAPSAELRPNQKDQDSLPEYDILDDIIEMFFENSEDLENIYKKYDKNLVDEVVKRTYKAQFKRKQACLGIRVTEKAFCSNLNLPITQKFY